MAKIICISDLHFSPSECSDVYAQCGLPDKVVKDVSEPKYDILFEALEAEGQIDFLIFCGDLIDGRKAIEEKKNSFNEFTTFLKKIIDSQKIFSPSLSKSEKKKSIIIVPGNHDVSREKSDVYTLFYDLFHDYSTPISQSKDERAAVFIFKKQKVIIGCVTTEDNCSVDDTNLQEAIELVNSLKKCKKETKDKIISLIETSKSNDIPSIVRKTKKTFIDRSKEIKRNQYSDYLKIVVTHHPLLSGTEVSTTVKKYNYTVGGYAFMMTAMNFGYQLFIHGHIHESSCVEVKNCLCDNSPIAVQLGIPNFEINANDKGIAVIETKKDYSFENQWPFEITYKKLDSLSMQFKQSTYISESKNFNIENDVSILVDSDIRELINKNNVIKNGDNKNIEAASYDCSLGYQYKISDSPYCDWTKKKYIQLTSENDKPAVIKLETNQTVLIFTYEEFDLPNNMIMHASPISSWLRKGIQIEISNFIDPGFKGRFCFPVTNKSKGSIEISSREPIISIEIYKLSHPCEKGWSERHPESLKKRADYVE